MSSEVEPRRSEALKPFPVGEPLWFQGPIPFSPPGRNPGQASADMPSRQRQVVEHFGRCLRPRQFSRGAAMLAGGGAPPFGIAALSPLRFRSEEHTSELQSLMRISYAVFCLKKKKT